MHARITVTMKYIAHIIIACFLYLNTADAQIDHGAAHRYFTEVQQLLREDAGRLWGKPLEGPVLLVDRNSRLVVANYPDRMGMLMRSGNVYTGKLPDNMPLANTAVEWAGIMWAMILTPVPDDPYSRNSLLIHELWHRIQEEIGFPTTDPSNNHLDMRDGRIWMQLEMRALQNALSHTGDQRREALRDALLFRAKRHSLYPSAADEERLLENHEGLAEYTGITLAISSEEDRMRFAVRKLRQAEQLQSYTRSFAYHTVPAYGVLLDAVFSGWSRSFSHRSHLPDLVRNRYGIQLPFSITDEAQRRARVYDGEHIILTETERDRERQATLAGYRNRFLTGPRLVLPLVERRISFDPRTVTPLENHGRVYTTMEVSDIWGILNVTEGALMSEDWNYVYVDKPENTRGRRIEGSGYILELREGWHVVPGERGGDYTVRQME
jgi:hypothetical protein